MTVNPFRDETPKPKPPQYKVGDLVSFMGDLYVVGMTLDIQHPPHEGWPKGTYLGLRWHTWPKTSWLIIPANDVEEPQQVAC